jgi:hypothetical protein
MKDWRRVNENTHPNLLFIYVWCIQDYKNSVGVHIRDIGSRTPYALHMSLKPRMDGGLWSSRQSMVKAGEGVWLASKAHIC